MYGIHAGLDDNELEKLMSFVYRLLKLRFPVEDVRMKMKHQR
jgi:hypothetical protein